MKREFENQKQRKFDHKGRQKLKMLEDGKIFKKNRKRERKGERSIAKEDFSREGTRTPKERKKR